MSEPAADPTPLGLRERKKQETHERILAAARALFEEKGFEATTVDAICAQAAVSPKTFFNYFATKQRVVREIAEAFLDDLGVLVEEARKRTGSTAERLAHLFGRAGEEALRAGPRHKELLVEVVRVAQVDGIGPEQSRRLHAAFEALLEDGAAAGDLTTEHDVAFLTEMVAGAFITILLNWQSLEGYPVREHLDEAARFLGRAIASAMTSAPPASSHLMERTLSEPTRTTFTIIGAGAGGLCAGIKLRERGREDFLIFDREPRVGGTWQRNTYPGLECDIASPLYCYSFAPNPDWSGPYPPHSEIREYLERVASDHGLDPHLRLGTGVVSARWDESCARWRLVLDDGGEVESQFVISAVGMFGAPVVPNIPGLDAFEGTMFHSATWDHEHDLRGERVAVIGSAASAVQFVPEIAPDVEQLHVFQRTPNWVAPKQNDPYSEEQKEAFRSQPELLAEGREQLFNLIETVLNYLQPEGLQLAEGAARQAIDVVEDPELRKKLTPDHPFGAKRPLASNKYYPVFNRSNVELVTDPIERVTAHGVVTADGKERPVDTILLATGYETQKYASVIDIVGRAGLAIGDAWEKGPEAYFGVATSGFPNLFMLYGPNTNGGNSLILMLEFQVDYALRLIDEAERAGVDWIDVRREVMDEYNASLQEELERVTVWKTGANDYYRAPSGRIVTQWPHGFAVYKERVSKDDLSSFETGKIQR